MPLPVAAMIGAGTSILGNVMSNAANAKQNAANRDFTSRWNHQNREWALEDWAMQNEYNSPKAQMARLRDANLNPHMVYGGGATTEAQQVRASPTGSYQGTPNRWDFSGVANSILQSQDIRLKEAQTDNLGMARAVMAADVLNKLQDVHTKEFDLKMKNELKETSVDMAKESLRKMSGDAQMSQVGAEIQDRNFDKIVKLKDLEYDRAKAEVMKSMNEANASQHLEKRVLQEIDNLKRDGDLKQFQINLNRLGINQSDPVYLRILTQLFGNKVKTP